MEYPSATAYHNAVQNCHACVLDPLLKTGSPKKKSTYGLSVFSGGYTRVFPVTTNNGIYALRCWTKEVENAESRYKEIKKYLDSCNLSCFVAFDYVSEGILVNGFKYPILRMEWAEGPNLKTFIKEHLHESKVLNKTSEQFLQTVSLLHQNHIAHGDLQHENIIVQQSQNDIDIILIDYDSLYIPAFKGMNDDIVGKPSFQHPSRINNKNGKASEYLDYFSELVIYLTLCAFSEKPELWDLFDIDTAEDFFFTEKDFLNPDHSKAFDAMNGLSETVCNLSGKLKDYCKQPDIDNFVPLENIIQPNQTHTNSLQQQSTANNASIKGKTVNNLMSKIQQLSSSKPVQQKQVVQEVNVDQLVNNINSAQFVSSSNLKKPEKGIDDLINNISKT